MIPRLIEQRVRTLWEHFPVVVLMGARQVGKTTLASELLPDASYVTLDVPAEAYRARVNPAELLEAQTGPVVIDELQYAPALLHQIQMRVDRERAPGQFFLVGSQSAPLLAALAESPATTAALTLPPLSLVELHQEPRLAQIDAYVWRGSYPQLWQQDDLDRDLWLGSYLGTYLERDVRNLLGVSSLRDFERFLRACALRVGQMLSYAELAREVGVAPNTAKSWLSVLVTSQLVFLLQPYPHARTRRLLKSPKLYFHDTALLTYLMGFQQAGELSRHALWGAVWENTIVSETVKLFLARGMRPPLWFWRTASGEELDLLIETDPGHFLALECSTAAQVESGALRGLRSLQAEHGDSSVPRALVVCRTELPYPLAPGGRLEAVPLAGRGGLLRRRELTGADADG
jgi:predicted AAA+ superfamily ATPase